MSNIAMKPMVKTARQVHTVIGDSDPLLEAVVVTDQTESVEFASVPRYVRDQRELEMATGWSWNDEEEVRTALKLLAPYHQDSVTSPLVIDPTRYFNQNNTFMPTWLGSEVEDGTKYRRGEDGRLYRYTGGVFRSDGEDIARFHCSQRLDDRYKKGRVTEVIGWFNDKSVPLTANHDRDWINCANTMVNWRTGATKLHDPDAESMIQIPVRYFPYAECPNIDGFLRQVLPEDCIEFMYELIGYCLLTENPFRKSVLFLGRGANGKSTLLRLIVALLGRQNCAYVPLQVLAENRFAPAQLYGKLANVCGDLDSRAVKRSDLFKQVTGGDTIMAEHKNKDPFHFTSFATPIFSANEAPASDDQTDAWFDRWVIVPFNNRFEGTSDDPHVLARLVTADEMSGLLRHAIDGLRRLMLRGRFELPESVKAENARYRREIDTVRTFVEDECTLDPTESIDRSELFKRYIEWCRSSRRIPVTNSRFYQSLQQEYGGQIEPRSRKLYGIVWGAYDDSYAASAANTPVVNHEK